MRLPSPMRRANAARAPRRRRARAERGRAARGAALRGARRGAGRAAMRSRDGARGASAPRSAADGHGNALRTRAEVSPLGSAGRGGPSAGPEAGGNGPRHEGCGTGHAAALGRRRVAVKPPRERAAEERGREGTGGARGRASGSSELGILFRADVSAARSASRPGFRASLSRFRVRFLPRASPLSRPRAPPLLRASSGLAPRLSRKRFPGLAPRLSRGVLCRFLSLPALPPPLFFLLSFPLVTSSRLSPPLPSPPPHPHTHTYTPKLSLPLLPFLRRTTWSSRCWATIRS